jgi:hypothetical protein
MAKTRFLSLFLIISILSQAQSKHDYVWVTGYGTTASEHGGGTRIDFNEPDPSYTRFELPHQFGFDMPCSISDENGNLQFYSNGCRIINADNEMIENGDDLSPGYFQGVECNNYPYGYDAYQEMLILPRPGHPDRYVYFYPCIANPNLGKVMYAEIDMAANEGKGKVIQKNVVLRDTARRQGSFAPVRHGNGRDWWLILPRETDNIYDFHLLTPDTILGPFTQYMEDEIASLYPKTGWNTVVSPDGNTFIRVTLTWLDGQIKFNRIFLYDLDRCTGTLSNPRVIEVYDPEAYASWAAISPNSRYLYFQTGQNKLYQFDLQANNIEASRILIGEYDGFIASTGAPCFFHAMALAPNNKIYMCTTSATFYFHTIHSPDEPGLACNFQQHDVELPTVSQIMMPLNPNYRLYDMPDTPCDTLGINAPATTVEFTESAEGFSLSPNPATNVVQLSADTPFSEGRLFVFNAAGQKVYEQDIKAGDYAQTFRVADWAPGPYFITITQSNGRQMTGKLLVTE